MEAWRWQRSVDVLVDRWAQLARKATQLHNACREVASKSGYRVATARARELQAEAARDGTAQEHMVELGQALGGEEGAGGVAGHEAQVRTDARVATSEARRASTVRQQMEVALGLLERLVATCDEATAFPRELQRLLRDIEAVLIGTNDMSPNVPEALVAKVAEAERLWEASARLAKDHLEGTLDNIIKFYFTGGCASPCACGVAERCQRATEDIPRLVQSPASPQGVPEVSPVSMEIQELTPALLQPQVTVVAILGELLATLHRRDKTLPMSLRCLCWDLEKFTRELRNSLYCTDDPWWRRNVTSKDDDPLTSLSQALAAYKSTPWTTWDHVTQAASKWHRSVAVLLDRWADLPSAATWHHNTCRKVATEMADMAATATARARELQDEAARYGTAQENMMELVLALGGEEGAEVVAGHEAQVRRDARVAASEARRASTVRQWVEEALGLLERLVAACDEAAAFPRELQRRVGDIEATLEGANEASPNVPEALVAKVAVAEQLWEANARLAKDHLEGTLDDIINLYVNGGPESPSGVAERCQRAIEDIPRLLRPLKHPQGVPKVSPLSPTLLQPQVTVVATLGELLAALPRRDEEMLPVSTLRLYWDLEEFTRALWDTRDCTDDPWWHCNVTSDDDDPVTSLSQALATYKSAPWTPRNHMTMVASKWQGSVSELVKSWAKLARAATELRNTCREVVTEAATEAITATTRARELQDEAACYWIDQEIMMELGLAMDWIEWAVMDTEHEAQVRRDAREAASRATMATMVRQRVETALGLLERLVAACAEATALPQELQLRIGDIGAALEGTNEASPNVSEDLVAKVAVAERLWEANARLAKDHLVGTLQDIIDCYFGCVPNNPHCHRVAEWCQRAIEDIPRLLRPPERPQSVPKVSPVSMELQKLSLALLQPQVTVVAILGELVATLPSQDEMILLLMAPRWLYWDLVDFTKEFQTTQYCFDDTWWHNVISDDDDPVTSLSQGLASCKSTPWTTRMRVTMVARKWQRLVAVLMDRWAELARKATKLRNTCRKVVNEAAYRVTAFTAQGRDPQDEAARDGTAQENMVELGQALGGEEGAEVLAGQEDQVRTDAWVAASKATMATKVRQRLEVALGLLEHLVAVCDEATAFPRELQHRVRDIKATLKEINEASPNVPEDLVAKVAVAERLWEANARLIKDHLVGTLDDIIDFLFTDDSANPSAREVSERCQRAIEDIPRLLQPPEHPQSVPKVSPVSTEPQELSPSLLRPQVTVVAIVGELLATLPWRDEEMLPKSPECLCWDLICFTQELRATLHRIDDTWRRQNVTSVDDDPLTSGDDDPLTSDDDDPPTSLSQPLAACKSTPGTTWDHVTMAASKWHRSVSVLVNSWARLARKATKLRNACKRAVNEAAYRVAAFTAWERDLQDKAARYWTAQEDILELSQALGREEGAKVVARREAQVREEAMKAASEARRATMVRQRMEVALGLLERLVAACDEATMFPRELQRLLRNIEAPLEGTNEGSPNVPEALVAKVALAKLLWEANIRVVKNHLVGTVEYIIKFYFFGHRTGPSTCVVAERCQRATEDITRLLRPQERPQGVHKVSPVTMELQELQALVAVVATLGELVATVTGPHRAKCLHKSPDSLQEDLRRFTRSLHAILDHGSVTSLSHCGVSSLGQALSALKVTPGTTCACASVRAAASAWWELVARLVDSWDWLAREATELRDNHRKMVTEQQMMVTLDKEEVAWEMATHDAQVVSATNEAMAEAGVATRRGHWVVMALGLLQRLVATCDRATLFNWIMECQLKDIEAILKGINEVSPEVLQALVAKVAEFERLWGASTRLAKDHLLGALGDIHDLLLSPCGDHGGPGGPSSRAVAERCQRAIEDIPRLLLGQ
ncbi:uncharacterized protein LOC132340501 isoform X2 [Haemorhous mexicanus]|uniref:uncharacterized protein LOC132340501 isoform X2 n=1 Tax=Haemorhous mexicanus TaxID=30427 RepID=UPI0028BDD3C2|nr:uncharacterized protein LOC132340501 isoform X2 [Haemorhous mexicanus]